MTLQKKLPGGVLQLHLISGHQGQTTISMQRNLETVTQKHVFFLFVSPSLLLLVPKPALCESTGGGVIKED